MQKFDVISIRGASILAHGEIFGDLTAAEIERRILSRNAVMRVSDGKPQKNGAEVKTSAPTESRPAGRPPKQRLY